MNYKRCLCAAVLAAIGLCLPQSARSYEFALQDVKSYEPFHEGLASFYDVGNTGLHGYIDASGRVVIEPRFKRAGEFIGGMAEVATETGNGLINRQGYFLLEPKYEYVIRDDENPNLFRVTDLSGKSGAFFNGRFVVPVEYETVSTDYPFVYYHRDGDERRNLNVVTGETYEDVIECNDYYYADNDGIDDKVYFDKSGYKIQNANFSVSSKGCEVFKDSTNYAYGIRNARTGKVVLPAKYIMTNQLWDNDLVVYHSMNDDVTGLDFDASGVIDASGKVIISSNNGKSFRVCGDYIYEYGDSQETLYDRTGKKLLPQMYESIYWKSGSWFSLESYDDKEFLFDAKSGKFYEGEVYDNKEGMLELKQGDVYRLVNTQTGELLSGIFDFVEDFSEGLCVVRLQDGSKQVIDKTGKVWLREDDMLDIEGEYFSEGVLAVDYDDMNCYVYNPLGHGDYVYNQEVHGDATIKRWWGIADKAFEDKNYDKAKEYYYRIMMDNPYDASAIIGYGASIHNLGEYEEAIKAYEAALKIDPDNATAKSNMEIAQNAIAEQKRRQQQSDNGRRQSVWSALENFGNVLMQMSGALQGGSPSGGSYSSGSGYSSGGYYDGGSSSGGGSGKSASYYQSQYDRWANLAQRHYNSLTTTGYRYKNKSGDRKGSTAAGMSSSNYTRQKRSLREAQSEMRKIRNEARRNGVTIRQSQWETATVDY